MSLPTVESSTAQPTAIQQNPPGRFKINQLEQTALTESPGTITRFLAQIPTHHFHRSISPPDWEVHLGHAVPMRYVWAPPVRHRFKRPSVVISTPRPNPKLSERRAMPDEISGGREALQMTTGEGAIPTGRKSNSYGASGRGGSYKLKSLTWGGMACIVPCERDR